MKKNLFILVALTCVVLGSFYLTASTTSVVRANIPFAFTVGKSYLPAGTYIVEFERLGSGAALGTCMVIKSESGKVYERVPSLPVSESEIKGQANLVFTKYANNYFLTRVESNGLASELKTSPAEKEMKARMNVKELQPSVAAD
jgi:hypothetical protein